MATNHNEFGAKAKKSSRRGRLSHNQVKKKSRCRGRKFITAEREEVGADPEKVAAELGKVVVKPENEQGKAVLPPSQKESPPRRERSTPSPEERSAMSKEQVSDKPGKKDATQSGNGTDERGRA